MLPSPRILAYWRTMTSPWSLRCTTECAHLLLQHSIVPQDYQSTGSWQRRPSLGRSRKTHNGMSGHRKACIGFQAASSARG